MLMLLTLKLLLLLLFMLLFLLLPLLFLALQVTLEVQLERPVRLELSVAVFTRVQFLFHFDLTNVPPRYVVGQVMVFKLTVRTLRTGQEKRRT